MPASTSFNVEFIVKVSYDNKHYAKELKCRWSPDDKKWKRSFTTIGEYGFKSPERMYDAIAEFIGGCQERNVDYDFDEMDLDELKNYIKTTRANMRSRFTYISNTPKVQAACLIQDD
jgi:hypothetical protein